jgi:hypothetical protein
MSVLPSLDQQLQSARDASGEEFSISHIDTCLSCYLQDHHHRDGELLLGVYVDGNTTIGDILRDLESEFNQMFLEDGERGGFNGDKASAAIAKLKEDNKDRLDTIFDSKLETPSEDDEDMGESCQAWFLIHWNVPDDDEEES